MTDPRIAIRDSLIHGKGVFAVENVPAGTAIVEYLGERVTRLEAERREAVKSGERITYILEYDDDSFIDGSVGGNEARYINHSCAPNCTIRRQDGRAFVCAIEHIITGQELLIDYAFDPDDDDVLCRCAAPGCRGVLNQAGPADFARP